MDKDGNKSGGRQAGTPNKSTIKIREIIDAQIEFREVISKLMELVNGVEVAKVEKGETVVYSEKPDSTAAKILLEYRFGKPQQSIDITSGEETINIIPALAGATIEQLRELIKGSDNKGSED